MIDHVLIGPKLEKLQEYTAYLKDYQKYSLEDLKKDHTLQAAVLRYLQLSIECAMDIGEMMISALKLRKPQEVREIITILGEHKILTADFAKRFAPAVNLRNILVHEYAEINLAKIYDHLQHHLVDFDTFARSIAQFLQNKK